jgi:hypothetical protein
MNIRFSRRKDIKRSDYNTREEFIFDKKTNVVPKKTNRLLCIIFSEDKGAYFLYRKMNLKQEIDYFHFKKGMYIIDNESIHITSNNNRVAFYLEGISTPIKMSNVEKETKEIEYIDLQGNKQKSIIEKIKGLKFDAKILDIFANRRFAELFTRQPTKALEPFILIVGIISLVMIGIGYGVTYYFTH